jgi:ketosteroid isomerase-like protein
MLIDRQAIRDCVYRYSRGVDRHDDELLASVFHPDAIDQHGNLFLGRAPDFVRWANGAHSGYVSHTHSITSHSCEIDGNVAHAESYVLTVHRHADGRRVRVLGGRYVDRFERRDGEWKIAVRRVLRDWRFDVSGAKFAVREDLQTDDRGFPLGRWDRHDLSYHLPSNG